MNLAHGEFVLVGGYILYVLCQGIGWPWPAALALTALGGALLGAALPPLVRRLPDREVNGLALTLGVAFVLQNLLLLGATVDLSRDSRRVLAADGRARAGGSRAGSRSWRPAAAAAALVGLDLWLHAYLDRVGPHGGRPVPARRGQPRHFSRPDGVGGVPDRRGDRVERRRTGAPDPLSHAGRGSRLDARGARRRLPGRTAPGRSPSWPRESRLASSSLWRRCSWEAGGARSWRAGAVLLWLLVRGRTRLADA